MMVGSHLLTIHPKTEHATVTHIHVRPPFVGTINKYDANQVIEQMMAHMKNSLVMDWKQLQMIPMLVMMVWGLMASGELVEEHLNYWETTLTLALTLVIDVGLMMLIMG
jgi:hypothetical protein